MKMKMQPNSSACVYSYSNTRLIPPFLMYFAFKPLSPDASHCDQNIQVEVTIETETD